MYANEFNGFVVAKECKKRRNARVEELMLHHVERNSIFARGRRLFMSGIEEIKYYWEYLHTSIRVGNGIKNYLPTPAINLCKL